MYPITNKDSRDCKQTPLIEPDGFQVHAISLVQKELAGRGGSGIGLINTFSMELEASLRLAAFVDIQVCSLAGTIKRREELGLQNAPTNVCS